MNSHTPQLKNIRIPVSRELKETLWTFRKCMQSCHHVCIYSVDPSLRNIINDIVAKEDINVHPYQSVERYVVHRMLRQHVFSFAFKRIHKVKTLNSPSADVVAPGNSIHPGLQRFLVLFMPAKVEIYYDNKNIQFNICVFDIITSTAPTLFIFYTHF